MDWIIGAFVFLVFCYFVFGRKETKHQARKSKVPVTADFIESGKIYRVEEATETIRQFVLALGDSTGYQWVSSAQEIAENFPKLLSRMKEEYGDELRDCEKDIEEANKRYEQLINDVTEDPDLDEDEKKDQITGIKIDLKDELKHLEKTKKWCEKQISSLEEDPTPTLKKLLSVLKKEHKEGNPPPDYVDSYLIDDFIKQSPL